VGDRLGWIIDLYPGQERWGRITHNDGLGGFIVAEWNTGTTTRVRHGSVRPYEKYNGQRRGYFRSEQAVDLAAVLADRRPDLAGALLAASAVRDGMNTEPPAPLPPGDQ